MKIAPGKNKERYMSKTLVAKPIIKNQYWVVTDGEYKVGNVQANRDGFEVKIDGVSINYSDTKTIQRVSNIQFINPKQPSYHQPPYAQWPTNGRTYNNILDIKRKMHLYTKSLKSKCYYAAGYYMIKMNGTWQLEFCPKYIFIQRYAYYGPYKAREEALDAFEQEKQSLKIE